MVFPTAYNQFLLAIPEILEGTGSTSPQLLVSYTIIDVNNVELHQTASYDLSKGADWSPGYYVVYLIKIDLNVITFSATVTPWKDGGNQIVEIK